MLSNLDMCRKEYLRKKSISHMLTVVWNQGTTSFVIQHNTDLPAKLTINKIKT